MSRRNVGQTVSSFSSHPCTLLSTDLSIILQEYPMQTTPVHILHVVNCDATLPVHRWSFFPPLLGGTEPLSMNFRSSLTRFLKRVRGRRYSRISLRYVKFNRQQRISRLNSDGMLKCWIEGVLFLIFLH